MTTLLRNKISLRLTAPFLLLAVMFAALPAFPADRTSYATKVANLIDPAKLATLGPRGANPRVQKYVALLAQAKAAGEKPETVAAETVKLVGMKAQAAKLTAKQMARNLRIAESCGCTDTDGLARMRRGEPARITRGKSKGDELSVDHIIPRQVVPELDNVIANLELMPLRLNEAKNASIGKRQVDLAQKLENAGLLSPQGTKALVRKRNPTAEVLKH